MTTTLSATALRMPHMASVAAPAPLAPGASAEPCAAGSDAPGFGGIIAPAFTGRWGGTDGGDRIGSDRFASAWHRQDTADIVGGGPLRE